MRRSSWPAPGDGATHIDYPDHQMFPPFAQYFVHTVLQPILPADLGAIDGKGRHGTVARAVKDGNPL
jgi:hypothetical protein